MPPTRGHDLKPLAFVYLNIYSPDAPHTGARLETEIVNTLISINIGMPPTRGHDLKRSDPCAAWLAGRMPPTRGHDLKLT